MEGIFKTIIKLTSLKNRSYKTSKGSLGQDIMTGYIGEQMHRNFYRLNKIRKNL